MTAPHHRASPEGEFDLVHALNVLRSNRWTIAAITVACFLAGTLYAFFATPTYQADLMIQTDSTGDAPAKNLLGDAASFFNVNAPASAEAQIITSRLVVSRVVDDLRSYIVARPKRFPLIGQFASRSNDGIARPGVLGLGGYAWANESVNVARFDVPRRAEGDRFTLTRIDAQRYRLAGSDLPHSVVGRIGVAQSFDTANGPLHIEVSGFDALPGTSFRLARNSRTDTIDALRVALDVSENVKQSGMLIATLRGQDPDLLYATLNALARRYVEQNVARRSSEAAQSIAFLTGQLALAKRQLEQVEDRYATLRNDSHSVDLDEEGKLALQQRADIVTRRLELRQRRDELAKRFLPSHPDMIALEAQLATLGYAHDTLEAHIARLPQEQREMVHSQLDVKVATELYSALLNNIRQLELVKAGKSGSVRVVDTAVVPDAPVRPNRPVVIGVATLIGLAVGLLVAFARDLAGGGLRDAGEVERHSGLPVLAAVPCAGPYRKTKPDIAGRRPGANLLVQTDPQAPVVESLRGLETALRFAGLRDGGRVLLVTGATAGAGTSFIAANLAGASVADGRRILLIDGDLRKGDLHRYFGLERGIGLADVLAGRASVDEIVHRSVGPSLDFISTGELPVSPATLLQGDGPAGLLTPLRERYDTIVIDSPPILAVADAAWLGTLASATLLVMRAASNHADALADSVKRLRVLGAPATTVVLNGVAPRGSRAHSFGNGGARHSERRHGDSFALAPMQSWLASLKHLLRRAA